MSPGVLGAICALRSDAINLFQRRHTLLHFFDSVAAEGDHSARGGHVAQLVKRGAVADQLETFVIRDEKLVDADSPGIAEVSAARATARAEQLFDAAGKFFDLPLLVQRRL